jgi:CHAT domain-containing protein
LHAAGHHGKAERSGPIERERTVIDRVVSSTTSTVGALIQARARMASKPELYRLLAAGLVDTPDYAETRVDRLPAVRDEVTAVTTSLSGVPATILTDLMSPPSPPTKLALIAGLPGHAWAHIACHAVTDPDRPALSQLLLADHQDDPFTVLDLTGLALPNPDLLYLSACTTARTGRGSLDEPVHFAAAAQLAGYRHVIATLWPLYDDAEPAGIIYGDLAHEGHPNTWDAAGAAAAVHHATHHLREASHRPRETPRVPIHAWATHIHLGP